MVKEIAKYAGFRYWTSSLLPALAGTTLPFWLRPPGFSFKLVVCIEFLIATLLFHSGFSFIYHGLDKRLEPEWSKPRLFVFGTILITVACLLGVHLNRYLYGIAFPYFGFAVVFIGILYVIPPLSFFRRAGGEIILAYGLGMLPVLGAFLVQVNDLTRKVYLVSLRMVVATGLWIWMEKLADRPADRNAGYGTLIDLFGLKASARFIPTALMGALYVSLLLTIISGACMPVAGIAFITIIFSYRIVKLSWHNYQDKKQMLTAKKHAIIIHLITGVCITISSLAMLFV